MDQLAPFRQSPQGMRPTCFNHALVSAVGSCIRCLQPVCEVCTIFVGSESCCPPCAGKQARARRVRQGVMGLAAVALLAGGAVAVSMATGGARRATGTDESGKPVENGKADWGTYTQGINAMLEQLAKEPCDRRQIVVLGETLLRAGDSRGAVQHAATFFKKCGAYPRLLWVTYSAHLRLSEHHAAVSDVSQLVELYPEDADYRWWRARAYEQGGELEKAVVDYKKSLELRPAMTNIPFNLSSVLERLGRPCEAIVPVENFIAHHPDTRDKPEITARLTRLRAAGGGCPAAAAPVTPAAVPPAPAASDSAPAAAPSTAP
jgi:tetratricopeptide (TPR) repeat protein